MKLVLEQPIYSLYNHQERIDQNTSLAIETIRSILENAFFSTNHYCSSLSKRIHVYSLSNQSIMTRTDLSEEQTDSLDYENTYLYSEEASKFDDSSSFTTITSNCTIQNDRSIASDIDENSLKIDAYLPYLAEDLIASSKSNLFKLKITPIDQQIHPIRSTVDNVSLNSSMTSFGKQLNTHEKKKKKKTNEGNDDNEYYIIVNHRKALRQITMINLNELDDDIESTRLYDTGQHDGMHSDESQYSDDFRYPSHPIINDDFSQTSSTLRQEVISTTKVRCKQRQTWFNTSNNQVDGINALIASPLNANMNSTKSTLFLHNAHKNENINVETPPYDFFQLNSDHHAMKTTESVVSPNNTHDKDAAAAVPTATESSTKNFYLIHHQSSLVPIRNFIHQKHRHSNIELIEMDENECVLEIIDGNVALVPKVKSISMHSDEEKSEEQEKSSSEDQISHNDDSPKREIHLLSVDSSISTPSISEREREHERDEISSSSSSSSRSSSANKEQVQKPFVLLRDIPAKSPPLPPSHNDQSVDLLDLFSTPPVPSTNSNANDHNKNSKNLLDDSLSSVSSYEEDFEKVRSSSPAENQSKPSSPSTSIKDDLPAKKESPVNDNQEIEYTIPKSEPPPAAKPINKARINEFASLLSGAVHLTQPQQTKKPEPPKILSAPSPARSEDQSYTSIRSAPSDRDERESYHTVQSNNTNSDLEQTKKHIDARYNEKIDDRKTIQINTSNIKALFEQKISDTNKALSQSNEHLLHLTESKQHQQHRKAPISYAGVKRNLPVVSQPINRRTSYQDSSSTMNKYSEHIGGAKDVVIEDKKPEQTHQTQQYGSVRRNNTEQIIRPGADSLTGSSGTSSNGYHAESLIAREIRETREKEEELRQQRKKCGLPEDISSTTPNSSTNTAKSDPSSKPPAKSSSFLSNLDFFTVKSNEPNSSRRSTISTPHIVYDSHGTSSTDERKSIVAQELNRFQENNVPIVRTSSTSNYLHRSSSNQNLSSTTNTNNIIQREIEAIRAQEAELRQLGRIQRTSDEHSDPRKYQEFVSPIPKSQSAHGKPRRETERIHGPMTATSNGILKPKPMNNNSAIPSMRGKFPSPNPTAPIISASNKTIDYSKLSSTDRLELEKRECQEREQELKKQRHSITGTALSVNSTMNGDSGNVSQDEHDEDPEHYFEKIQRLKRTENEKAQAPLVRPTKKLDLSQKWEQMVANKANNPSDDYDDVEDKF